MATVLDEPMREFHSGIHNENTRAIYQRNLEYFFRDMQTTPEAFVKLTTEKQLSIVGEYMGLLHGKITANTIRSRYAALKNFCVMNKLFETKEYLYFEKKLPKLSLKDDRLPTKEELNLLFYRLRPQGRRLFKLLLESAIRIEGASELKESDFEPLPDHGICKITVYSGGEAEYFTFCSMETYNEITSKKGKRLFPKLGGTRAILYRGWKSAGVKVEFSSNHVFRKLFKTNAERSGAKSVWIELLMGHKIGLDKHYLRENMDDIIAAYKQIMPYLSINGNGDKQKQQTEFEAMKAQIEELSREKESQKKKYAVMEGYMKLSNHMAMQHDGKADILHCSECKELGKNFTNYLAASTDGKLKIVMD